MAVGIFLLMISSHTIFLSEVAQMVNDLLYRNVNTSPISFLPTLIKLMNNENIKCQLLFLLYTSSS